MQAKLIPSAGGDPIPILRDLTLVGRKRGLCDLVIDRSSISKLHCLLVKTDGLLFVRDLGSTNGTTVNGQRVTRGALLPGDELAFASVRFRVFLGPAEPKGTEEVGPEEPTEMLRVAPEEGYLGSLAADEADFAGISDPDRPLEVAEGEQVEALSDSGSQSDVRLLTDD